MAEKGRANDREEAQLNECKCPEENYVLHLQYGVDDFNNIPDFVSIDSVLVERRRQARGVPACSDYT